MNMGYKRIVERIKKLKWEKLTANDLQQLMVLSTFSAIEFAESLRVALHVYPENEELKKMAEGELFTTNLNFGGYNLRGDHADFLCK